MYKKSEQVINQGFSKSARILLGMVSGLFGFMFIMIASDSKAPFYMTLFGIFCLIISLGCIVTGRSRQFIGSVIGLCILLISFGYVIDQLLYGPLFSDRSGTSIFNSILFFVFFGLPSLRYIFKTKFGMNYIKYETKNKK